MTEVELQPQTNGIEAGEDDANAVRPADIEAVSILCFVIVFLFLICDDIFTNELKIKNKQPFAG